MDRRPGGWACMAARTASAPPARSARVRPTGDARSPCSASRPPACTVHPTASAQETIGIEGSRAGGRCCEVFVQDLNSITGIYCVDAGNISCYDVIDEVRVCWHQKLKILNRGATSQ